MPGENPHYFLFFHQKILLFFTNNQPQADPSSRFIAS
jgi:hypothetical protein